MEKHNKTPIVWQLSALHLNNKTFISGDLLNDIPFAYDKQISNLRNFLKVIKTYFIYVYGNKDIFITSNGKTIKTKTDKHGRFSVVIDFLHIGELNIRADLNDKPMRIVQTYPIVFQNTKSPFDVITDIDDTILVSYTADLFKRIGTLIFRAPQNRKPVDVSQKLLQEFEKQHARTIYISKSESNLFGMLSSFIEYSKLPKGKLFLTPYLKLSQLINSKKGLDYKLKNIRFILENSGDKKYVLLGDDSQQDMLVYSEIVRDFPKRILKVYVRQTKRNKLPYQKKMWGKLKSTDIPSLYFKSETQIDVNKEIEQLKNGES